MLKILSIAIISLYILSVCIKQKGIPYSISATYYRLKYKFIFLMAMWGTAGFLMPYILESSKTGTGFLAFIGLSGMAIVGAAPNFKEDFEGKVHTAGAIMSLVGSQAWVAVNNPEHLVIWVDYVLYTIVYMLTSKGTFKERFLRTKPMFWMEVSALLSILSA